MIEDIGDAIDLLGDARDLVDLIAMAVRHQPDSDAKAIAAGAHIALERIEQVKAGLQGLWHPEGVA